jgi:hypothetical protein
MADPVTTGLWAKERGTTTRNPCLFAALLVALGTLWMGTPATSAAETQVPFAGSYSGAAVADFERGMATFNGTGTATHLGSGENEGRIQVTGPDSSCPNGLANTNVETLIAGDGDSLVITGYDVACPIDSTGARFDGTGHWVVTGGTGRFTHATGEGTIDGGADFIQGVFGFELTGTISLPDED